MTQPDPNAPSNGTWSWAVQRELDGLQRSIDQRLIELSGRVDKSVSSTEYTADKRGSDLERQGLREKIADVDKDLEAFKADIRRTLDGSRIDNLTEHARLEKLITDEVARRLAQREEDERARRSNLRWIIGIVIIPVIMIIVTIFYGKH